MTPLPKRKLSTKRQGKRRAHIKLQMSAAIACPNCHKLTPPHQVCRHCGYYEGRQFKTIKPHADKK